MVAEPSRERAMTDRVYTVRMADELHHLEVVARAHEKDMAALRYRTEAAEAAVARLEGKVASLQTQIAVMMWGLGVALGGMVAAVAWAAWLG